MPQAPARHAEPTLAPPGSMARAVPARLGVPRPRTISPIPGPASAGRRRLGPDPVAQDEVYINDAVYRMGVVDVARDGFGAGEAVGGPRIPP